MWALRIQTRDHVLQAFQSKRQDPVCRTGRLLGDSNPKAAARMVQVEVLGFCLLYVFLTFLYYIFYIHFDRML